MFVCLVWNFANLTKSANYSVFGKYSTIMKTSENSKIIMNITGWRKLFSFSFILFWKTVSKFFFFIIRKFFYFDIPLKFIYSKKATKFCEIFALLLTVCTVVKSKVKISQNFVAFSEYMNFTFEQEKSNKLFWNFNITTSSYE